MIVPSGRRQNDRNREVIPNPRPIQRLCIISGENMRGMCRMCPCPPLAMLPSTKGGKWGTPVLGIARGQHHTSTRRSNRGRGGSGNSGRKSGQGGNCSANLTGGQ